MKKEMKRVSTLILAAVMATGLVACGDTKTNTDTPKTDGDSSKAASGSFTPRLDTDASVDLLIAGFMGNFEALDQVVNAFNDIYPNVVITYEQNNTHMLNEYMLNNTDVDIFMTTDDNVRDASVPEDYVAEYCLDLSQEDIDLSAVLPEAVSYCTVDGSLLRAPVMMNPCGIVVNKTLLEKEDLAVPKNYQEFLDTLDALRTKSYVPIQGSAIHVYSELGINMLMNMIHEDEDLAGQLEAGDTAAVEKVLPVFERLQTIIDEGYTDFSINSELPDDNYDASIMNFFEGDVPFWVCTSECYSGMKKRESKSEAFSADPFEYAFMYAPMGDDGAYVYTEPWYGFSVSKDSDEKDYAVEFIRFMMTYDALETMASVKGMPSAAVNGVDERYPEIHNIENLQAEFVNDGSVSNAIRTAFANSANALGAGTFADARAAAKDFVSACAK